MGILHRVYAQHAPEVWEAETRLLHAMRLVRRPVAVQWIVTSACDLHCPHCYSGAGKRTANELSTDEARRLIIDEMRALGRPTLVLAGGELLLRKDIPELVDYACEQGLTWAMHTHGLHVPRFRELFRRRPPSLAAISLDGDRDEHDAFRGRKGSFDGAIEAMRVLKEEGCGEVVAGTTVTRRNADRIEELFPIVRGSAADSWGLHLFAPEGRGAEHLDLVPTPEQLKRVAAFAREARRTFHVELCNEWGSAGEDDTLYRDQPFLCGAGRVSFVVSAGGEVLPCTTTDLGESEGNVRATPLRRIWSQGFVRFRSAGHGACSEGGECWLQARNGVRCGQAAFGAAAPRSSLAPPLLDRLPAPAPGREVGLVSERGARVVRAAALAAVMLEATAQRVRSSPGDAGLGAIREALAQGPKDFPALSDAQVRQHDRVWRGLWSPLISELRKEQGSNWTMARALARDLGKGTPLSRLMLAHIDRRVSLEGDSVGQLRALLDAAETYAVFDAALVDYLWWRSRDLPVNLPAADAAALARLDERLERHLRVAWALSSARASVGPLELRPWLSKAAPPPGYRETPAKPKELLDAAKKAFPGASSAAFTERGAVSLKLLSGSATLQRPSGPRALAAGDRVTVARLDLLRCSAACTFEHAELGKIELPAGSSASAYALSQQLSPDAQKKLDELIATVGKGDDSALAALKASAGLAPRRIARFLAQNPEASGTGVLRGIEQMAGDLARRVGLQAPEDGQVTGVAGCLARPQDDQLGT